MIDLDLHDQPLRACRQPPRNRRSPKRSARFRRRNRIRGASKAVTAQATNTGSHVELAQPMNGRDQSWRNHRRCAARPRGGEVAVASLAIVRLEIESDPVCGFLRSRRHARHVRRGDSMSNCPSCRDRSKRACTWMDRVHELIGRARFRPGPDQPG